MIGKNEIENYMYVEWLEAREVIIATKKRNKQKRTEPEHKGTSPQRLSAETSYRDFLFGKKAEQQPQKDKEQKK